MLPWYALVFISAAILAVSDIMRKHVLKNQHPLEQLAAEAPFRLLIVLFLIPFVALPGLGTLVLIALAALVLVAAMVVRNRAFRHLPISTVAPLQNGSPVILLVLAILVLGERPSALQAFGILLIVAGGYLLELREKQPFSPIKRLLNNPHAALLGLFLLIISVMALIDKHMLSNVGIAPLTYLFWLYVFFALFSVIIDMARYNLKGVAEDIRKGWYWLLLLAIAGVGNILFFYQALAIPGVLVSLAVPIRRTATLIETLFGGHLFHEDGVWRKAGACAVMLVGVLFVV